MPVDEVELTKELSDHKHRIGSLEHRMDDAEEIIREIHTIGKNMEVLVIKAENTDQNIKKLSKDMDTVKQKPAKRMDQITTAIIAALSGAVITAIVSAIFMAMQS